MIPMYLIELQQFNGVRFIGRDIIVDGSVYIPRLCVCHIKTWRTLGTPLLIALWCIGTSKPTGDRYIMYTIKNTCNFISRNEFMQWIDGAVVDLTGHYRNEWSEFNDG